MVFFGGGAPKGEFGHAVVQISGTGGLDLDDEGDEIIFRDGDGNFKAVFSYGSEGNGGVSMSRESDADGPEDPFLVHSDLPDAQGAPWSPGVKPDNTWFNLNPAVESANAENLSQGQAGQTSYEFSVIYADDYGINPATIDANDLTVTGGATVTAAQKTGGTAKDPAVAYTVTPPGGTWDEADNGTYTIALAKEQVADDGGLFVPEDTDLESFTVRIDQPPPVVDAGQDRPTNRSFTQTANAQDSLNPMTYAWSKHSGPGTVTFGSPDALATTIAASTSRPRPLSNYTPPLAETNLPERRPERRRRHGRPQ